jgi:hypothetical protein
MQRQPIIWYLLLYALFLAAMYFGYGFGVTEPVLVLLLFGLGLSLLALWTTRHAKPRNITVKHPRQESAILGGYLVIVVVFITWGLPGVRLISAQPMLQAVLVTIAKLLVIVIVPFAIWRAVWRYRVREFVDLRAAISGHWRALVVVSLALLTLLHRSHLGDWLLSRGPLDSHPEPPAARAYSHRWRPAAQPRGHHSPVETWRLTHVVAGESRN